MSENLETENGQPPLSEEERTGIEAALMTGARQQSEVAAALATARSNLPSAQVLYANVRADGTLVNGFGASSASLGPSVGEYIVTFAWIILGGTWVATLGRWDGTGLSLPGHAVTNLRSGTVNAVYVRTRDETGRPAARDFHLMVATPF